MVGPGHISCMQRSCTGWIYDKTQVACEAAGECSCNVADTIIMSLIYCDIVVLQ